MIFVKIGSVRVKLSARSLIRFYPNFPYLLNVLGEIRNMKTSCRLLDGCVSLSNWISEGHEYLKA